MLSTASTSFSGYLTRRLGGIKFDVAPALHLRALRNAQAELETMLCPNMGIGGVTWFCFAYSDAELARLPPRIPYEGGAVAPVVRQPVPPYPANLPAGAQPGVVQMHKEQKQIFDEYVFAEALMKNETITIMGENLRRRMEAAHPNGIARMSNLDVQTWLFTNVGTPTSEDIQQLLDRTKVSFVIPYEFPLNAAMMQHAFADLDFIGHPVSQHEKLRQLRDNMSTNALLLTYLEKYEAANDPAARTFNAAVDFIAQLVSRHTFTPAERLNYTALAAARTQSAVMSSTTAPPAVTTAPPAASAAAAGGRGPAAGRGRGGCAGRGAGRGGRAPQYGPLAAVQPAAAPGGVTYCFLPGFGHPGTQCRVMLANRAVYTDDYVNCATPGAVVNGYKGHPGPNAMHPAVSS